MCEALATCWCVCVCVCMCVSVRKALSVWLSVRRKALTWCVLVARDVCVVCVGMCEGHSVCFCCHDELLWFLTASHHCSNKSTRGLPTGGPNINIMDSLYAESVCVCVSVCVFNEDA